MFFPRLRLLQYRSQLISKAILQSKRVCSRRDSRGRVGRAGNQLLFRSHELRLHMASNVPRTFWSCKDFHECSYGRRRLKKDCWSDSMVEEVGTQVSAPIALTIFCYWLVPPCNHPPRRFCVTRDLFCHVMPFLKWRLLFMQLPASASKIITSLHTRASYASLFGKAEYMYSPLYIASSWSGRITQPTLSQSVELAFVNMLRIAGKVIRNQSWAAGVVGLISGPWIFLYKFLRPIFRPIIITTRVSAQRCIQSPYTECPDWPKVPDHIVLDL